MLINNYATYSIVRFSAANICVFDRKIASSLLRNLANLCSSSCRMSWVPQINRTLAIPNAGLGERHSFSKTMLSVSKAMTGYGVYRRGVGRALEQSQIARGGILRQPSRRQDCDFRSGALMGERRPAMTPGILGKSQRDL